MRPIRTISAIALLAISGCAGGGLGNVLGGVLGGGQTLPGESGTVVAEVRGVDQRNQRIDVRTEDGQSVGIRYDQQTRVVYQQRDYDVTALESGDVVRMSLQRTSGNEYYTQRIDVQQSAQDRGYNDRDPSYGSYGSYGSRDPERVYQVSGTVDQIDTDRGLFVVRTSDRESLTVAMPYNATSSTRDRFNRLRRGNSVTFEGRFVTATRVELTRFR
jgi:hypothetical protein